MERLKKALALVSVACIIIGMFILVYPFFTRGMPSLIEVAIAAVLIVVAFAISPDTRSLALKEVKTFGKKKEKEVKKPVEKESS